MSHNSHVTTLLPDSPLVGASGAGASVTLTSPLWAPGCSVSGVVVTVGSVVVAACSGGAVACSGATPV